MLFSQSLNTHRIFKRLAKALIRLRVCAGWSEPLLVARTHHIVGNLMSRLIPKLFTKVNNDNPHVAKTHS